jgi:opacity protein-like surface antigen
MRIPFRVVAPLSAVLMVLLTPSIASADITAFLGVNGTPTNRSVKGFAVGAGLLVAGFEFEYANTSEDLTNAAELAPGLRTFMFNGLVQTPFPIAGFQPYATAGGGVYRETLSLPDISETNVAINVGGGVKMSLAGPLRLRFDYRVLTLKGDALHSTVQRFYAGVNLKF